MSNHTLSYRRHAITADTFLLQTLNLEQKNQVSIGLGNTLLKNRHQAVMLMTLASNLTAHFDTQS